MFLEATSHPLGWPPTWTLGLYLVTFIFSRLGKGGLLFTPPSSHRLLTLKGTQFCHKVWRWFFLFIICFLRFLISSFYYYLFFSVSYFYSFLPINIPEGGVDRVVCTGTNRHPSALEGPNFHLQAFRRFITSMYLSFVSLSLFLK